MRSPLEYLCLFFLWVPATLGVGLIARGIARQCRRRNGFKLTKRQRLHL